MTTAPEPTAPEYRACLPVRPRVEHTALAGLVALGEHPGNHPPAAICRALFGSDRLDPSLVREAIHLVGKTWEPGRVLRFRFLDGSPVQRSKVRRWAEEWLSYARLGMDFEGGADAEVRVTFRPGGSWSLIGTDCLAVPRGPTMQFGWVTDASDPVADRAVVLHEVGHALGLGHEQSSPDRDIEWNKPRALAYYMRTQGWDAAMVEANVFEVYGRSEVEGTPYDRLSIMQYPVPAELTLDGRGIGWNTDLSAFDKAEAAALYPGRADPPAPPPPDKPVQTPVVPGGPVARASAPAGQPARFVLEVAPAGTTLALSFAVDRSFGRPPVVVARAPGGPPRVLADPAGRALVRFRAGRHDLDVYHPLPAVAVAAAVRAVALT